MFYSRSSELCSSLCTPKCTALCFEIPKIPGQILPRPSLPLPPRRTTPPLPLPLPPRRTTPPLRSTAGNHPQVKILLLLTFITTATLLGAIFMVCLLVKKLREWQSSRRNGSALFYVQEESTLDEDESPPISDHHVWFIHTVGLHQSVIDSITVFKYNKAEKLIDESDCSICLGEFRDDERLRLLPKCSHAFHVPCIDMWLKSHKNCPLCRAPVVSESTRIEPVTAPAPPVEAETEEENRGGETSGEISEILIKEMYRSQVMRRSVSMDLVSREEGSSSTVEVKDSDSISRNVEFAMGEIGNQSLCKIVKSFGCSGERKLEWGSHYRSQSSVLPL